MLTFSSMVDEDVSIKVDRIALATLLLRFVVYNYSLFTFVLVVSSDSPHTLSLSLSLSLSRDGACAVVSHRVLQVTGFTVKQRKSLIMLRVVFTSC